MSLFEFKESVDGIYLMRAIAAVHKIKVLDDKISQKDKLRLFFELKKERTTDEAMALLTHEHFDAVLKYMVGGA